VGCVVGVDFVFVPWLIRGVPRPYKAIHSEWMRPVGGYGMLVKFFASCSGAANALYDMIVVMTCFQLGTALRLAFCSVIGHVAKI